MHYYHLYNYIHENSFDPAIIISLITAVAAFLTAIVTGQQVRSAKLSTQADTFLRLTDRFDDFPFREKRYLAAISCLKNLSTKKPDNSVDDVLDFFEDVCFLVHKKALDKDMAWHGFYNWMRLYYQSSKNYIEEQRNAESGLWEYLTLVYPQLEQREMESNKFITKLSETKLKNDLEDEIKDYLEHLQSQKSSNVVP